MKIIRGLMLLAVYTLLLACSSDGSQAPVIDGWKQSASAGRDYRVQPGDTLYSVAWGFGVDYHDLARYNQLTEPYAIHEGQILHMSPPPAATPTSTPAPKTVQPTTSVVNTAPALVPAVTESQKSAAPVTSTAQSPANTPAAVTATASSSAVVVKPAAAAVQTQTSGKWLWPTKGKVVRGYSAADGGNHGLDIAGKLNQPVVASAAGKVVYAGSGMPGYGNLIIIKHNENDLSAYAFNKKLEVKEGDSVKAGQCIAYMGKNDDGHTLLHFEIRRDGKPVDPRNYLK